MQWFYKVQPGDTLYTIAKRWELPVQSLIAANNFRPPYTIYIGQQLSMPPGLNRYRVKRGDTISKIADSYRIPVSVLVRANQLHPPYIIYPDQLLLIQPGEPFYIVQPGDTLYSLAQRFNVVTNDLVNYTLIKHINGLTSDTIYPGMRLIIPYAPSGDKGILAYFSGIGDIFDLSFYYPSDGRNRQITVGLGSINSVPFWAPDGSKIAFVGRRNFLYVFHLADGSIAQIEQFEEGFGNYLDWCSKSECLVYTKGHDIVIYNTESHEARRIAANQPKDAQWFPNNEEILYQDIDETGTSQLYIVQKNGDSRRQITNNTGERHNHVRLSPDGLYVAYTSPGASISIIYSLEIKTGKIYEIKGGPLAKNYMPAWSPGSLKIAFSSSAYDDRGYFSQIRTVLRNGEEEKVGAISDCYSTPVTWAPNSNKLAYLSGCEGEQLANEIWLLDVERYLPIRLYTGNSSIISLKWSPKQSDSKLKTYRNNVFRVQLQYPSNWIRISSERFEGEDGFIQIGAIESGDTLQEVCKTEAFHQLEPYGRAPVIEKLEINDQEACLILPSEDQPAEMNNQAAIIIVYPKEIIINGAAYNYFILWADALHIRQIGETIKFI